MSETTPALIQDIVAIGRAVAAVLVLVAAVLAAVQARRAGPPPATAAAVAGGVAIALAGAGQRATGHEGEEHL